MVTPFYLTRVGKIEDVLMGKLAVWEFVFRATANESCADIGFNTSGSGRML